MVNLKTNFDGKGFKTPSPEYLDFVKRKRSQLYRIGLTTSAAVTLAAIGLAYMRGHATPEMIGWILAFNFLGLCFGYGISALAK